MANEGCCVGGQECYTYYETVCDQSVTQRCRPKFKQVCVQETLPYCTVQKKRGSVVSCEKVFSFSIFSHIFHTFQKCEMCLFPLLCKTHRGIYLKVKRKSNHVPNSPSKQ